MRSYSSLREQTTQLFRVVGSVACVDDVTRTLR